MNSPLSHSGLSPYSIIGIVLNFIESHSDLGINVDRDLQFNGHVRSYVLATAGLPTNQLSCALNRSIEFMVNLIVTHTRHKLY